MSNQVHKCEKCGVEPVGYNDDGELLCEDCLFEWLCVEVMEGEP